MKRKLLRTLLVAATLLVGANAWGQTTTTLLEYGTSDVSWTAAGLATWTSSVATSLADDASYVKYEGSDNSDFSTYKTISPTSGNIINVTAVWRARSNTGRYWNESCGIYFRFGNIVVAQNDQDNLHGYVFTGLSNLSSVTTFTAGSYRTDVANLPWLKIEMEINTATNTLTSFSVKSEDGTTTYASASNVALTDPDYTTVAFGFQRGGRHTDQKQEQLKSVKITETTPSVSYAHYTVHFVDGDGATVKPDETRNGEVGSTVNANSDDMTTYYTSDYKYVYNNDGGGVEVVAAGTSELTVTYGKYGKYTATASAVSGGSQLQANIGSVTAFEGENATIQLNKYINVGGVWYSTSNPYVDVTGSGDNEVEYTASDIDYFYEFESLSGNRVDEINKAYSGGIRSRVSNNSSLTTPEEITGGIYTLTVPYYNSNSTAGKLYLYTVVGGVETDTELTIDAPQGTSTVTVTVVIPDGGALRFKNTNANYNDNSRIDYFTLKKHIVTLTSSANLQGYKTFYNADKAFKVDDNTTIYTAATPNGTTVTITPVTGKIIPANTPVILKTTNSDDYKIVLTETSEISNDDFTGNVLLAATVSGTIDGAYILAYTTANGLGFYPYSASLDAGDVYLTAASAAHIRIVFDDDTVTGISNVKDADSENGAMFNLSGQRVNNGYKGIVIKNGKKYLVK